MATLYTTTLSGRGMGMGAPCYTTTLSGRAHSSAPLYSPILSGRGLAPGLWRSSLRPLYEGAHHIRPDAYGGPPRMRGHGSATMPGKKLLEAGKQLAAAKNLIVNQTTHEMINPLTTMVMEEHDGIVVKRPRGRPARSKGQMPSGGKLVSLPHEKAGQKHTQKGLQALASAQHGSGLYF